MWNEPLQREFGVIVSSAADWSLGAILPVFTTTAITLGLTTFFLGPWVGASLHLNLDLCARAMCARALEFRSVCTCYVCTCYMCMCYVSRYDCTFVQRSTKK
jgi:hypothetical protein